GAGLHGGEDRGAVAADHAVGHRAVGGGKDVEEVPAAAALLAQLGLALDELEHRRRHGGLVAGGEAGSDVEEEVGVGAHGGVGGVASGGEGGVDLGAGGGVEVELGDRGLFGRRGEALGEAVFVALDDGRAL